MLLIYCFRIHLGLPCKTKLIKIKLILPEKWPFQSRTVWTHALPMGAIIENTLVLSKTDLMYSKLLSLQVMGQFSWFLIYFIPRDLYYKKIILGWWYSWYFIVHIGSKVSPVCQFTAPRRSACYNSPNIIGQWYWANNALS